MYKAIIGLGNPGPQFDWTRHNAGWRVIDLLAAKASTAPVEFEAVRAQTALSRQSNTDLVLVKPTTGMNSSGEAARLVSALHSIAPSDILVVHDDVMLPMGKMRFQSGGGAGGQHGIESMIAELGTRDFHRLKLGVGPDPGGAKRFEFVLAQITEAERPLYNRMLDVACEAVAHWADRGAQSAMTTYNGKTVAV